MTLAPAWPPGRPRILLTDAWLANAGDAALAVATEALVREVRPAAAVVHAAYQGATLGAHLPGLCFTGSLEELIGTPWAPPAPRWADAGPALVAGADAVISQGGGFLMEAYEPWGRVAALDEVTCRGVPVAILGQTVDRFSHPPGSLHRLMRKAELVVVRDAPSVANAAALGARDVVQGTDLALALFPEPPGDRVRRGIGLVLTDHHPDPGQRARVAEAARRVAAATLEAAPGEPVTVWSTVAGHPELAGEDDAVFGQSVVAALTPHQRARVDVLTGYVPPGQAIALAGEFRALVSMRLHPTLFAAALDTPFCLVLSGQKAAIFDDTALRARVVDPGGGPELSGRVAAALGAGGVGQWEALAPLRGRLDEVRSRLAGFLELAPGKEG